MDKKIGGEVNLSGVAKGTSYLDRIHIISAILRFITVSSTYNAYYLDYYFKIYYSAFSYLNVK